MSIVAKVQEVIDSLSPFLKPLLSQDISSFSDDQVAMAAGFIADKVGLPKTALGTLLTVHRGITSGRSIKDLLEDGAFKQELEALAELKPQPSAFCRCLGCGLTYETADYFQTVSGNRLLTECVHCGRSNFTSVEG